MAIWNKLFDNKKKKNNDDDGQEQYFKDEYKSIEKKAPEKAKPEAKKEVKPATKTVTPAPKKTVASETKTAKASPKKVEEKPVKPAKKSVESASKTTSANKTTVKPKANTASAAKTTVAKTTSAKTTSATKTATAKAVKSTTAKADTKTKATKELELGDDSPEVKGAVSVKEGRETANGKFDIRRAKDGRFFFSLYASNGAVIAYSQIYSSITAVNTGIASVIANAEKAEIEDTTLKKSVSLPCPKWEIYIDKAGEYRFRLYAVNGLCVCHSSHGYATKGGCKGGMESIKRFAADATVDKSYLK